MSKKFNREQVHVMVDIETTGLNPADSGIWQIGACVVTDPINQFEATLNPSLYIEQGRYEEVTVQWQGKQNLVNWNHAMDLSSPANAQYQLLRGFLSWIYEVKPDWIWSKGSFDFHHLHAGFKDCDLEAPWKYWQELDLRTICTFLNMPVPTVVGAHNALTDAQAQAFHLDCILLGTGGQYE